MPLYRLCLGAALQLHRPLGLVEVALPLVLVVQPLVVALAVASHRLLLTGIVKLARPMAVPSG